MNLRFSHEFPFPLRDVLQCIFDQVAENGELSVSSSDALTTSHSGTIQGQATVGLLKMFGNRDAIRWKYTYDWDPDLLERKWQIELLAYASYVKKFSGVSAYSSFIRDEQEYTCQKAQACIKISDGPLRTFIEQGAAAALQKAARRDQAQLLHILAHRKALEGGRVMKLEEQSYGLWEDFKIGNLWPFWLGTIATSAAAGFFLGGSDLRSYIPIMFAFEVTVLFVVAFATTGFNRKNMFGFFLGLFNLFFWLGWYIVQLVNSRG